MTPISATATGSARTTRSISFEPEHFAHMTRRAKVERRSFNWLINELVRKDLEASGDLPPSTTTAKE